MPSKNRNTPASRAAPSSGEAPAERKSSPRVGGSDPPHANTSSGTPRQPTSTIPSKAQLRRFQKKNPDIKQLMKSLRNILKVEVNLKFIIIKQIEQLEQQELGDDDIDKWYDLAEGPGAAVAVADAYMDAVFEMRPAQDEHLVCQLMETLTHYKNGAIMGGKIGVHGWHLFAWLEAWLKLANSLEGFVKYVTTWNGVNRGKTVPKYELPGYSYKWWGENEKTLQGDIFKVWPPGRLGFNMEATLRKMMLQISATDKSKGAIQHATPKQT